MNKIVVNRLNELLSERDKSEKELEKAKDKKNELIKATLEKPHEKWAEIFSDARFIQEMRKKAGLPDVIEVDCSVQPGVSLNRGDGQLEINVFGKSTGYCLDIDKAFLIIKKAPYELERVEYPSTLVADIALDIAINWNKTVAKNIGKISMELLNQAAENREQVRRISAFIADFKPVAKENEKDESFER